MFQSVSFSLQKFEKCGRSINTYHVHWKQIHMYSYHNCFFEVLETLFGILVMFSRLIPHSTPHHPIVSPNFVPSLPLIQILLVTRAWLKSHVLYMVRTLMVRMFMTLLFIIIYWIPLPMPWTLPPYYIQGHRLVKP